MLEEAPKIARSEWRRPAPEHVEALRGVPTGHVVDALGGAAALDHRIKPAIADQARFCGVALTCHTGPADNLALIHALASVQAGDVLVAATDGHTACAVTGDLVLATVVSRGENDEPVEPITEVPGSPPILA
jgi:4-hydroxy-4-methyl-2-oxoglutarate aldolase